MSTFDWIIRLVSEYWQSFLVGTGNTMLMALVGTAAGFVIGLLIAMVRTIPIGEGASPFRKWVFRIVNFILNAYVEIIRGTPMLVQALIIHYSLFVPLKMHHLLSAIIIISFTIVLRTCRVLKPMLFKKALALWRIPKKEIVSPAAISKLPEGM